jgi:hypothetical protein
MIGLDKVRSYSETAVFTKREGFARREETDPASRNFHAIAKQRGTLAD